MNVSRTQVIVAVAAVAAVVAAGWYVLRIGPGGVMGGARTVEGPASVPMAGILMVENYWIVLDALHVPREDTDCATAGYLTQCPLISAGALAEIVAGETVRCDIRRYEGDERNYGMCGTVDPATGGYRDGPDNVNRQLVALGWARSDLDRSDVFLYEGRAARDAKLGMWSEFYVEVPPRQGTIGPVNEVNDGQTVEVQETRVLLYGIDSPHLSQECTMNGIPYACGILAHAYLQRLIVGRVLLCHIDRLGDERSWGRCGDTNASRSDIREGAPTLNEQMVRAGWAVADRGQTRDYVPAEEEARREKRGLWAGEFVNPEDWLNGVR